MKATGRRSALDPEEVETYSEYKEKLGNAIIDSTHLNMRKIRVSSLKGEDKRFLQQQLIRITNNENF